MTRDHDPEALDRRVRRLLADLEAHMRMMQDLETKLNEWREQWE